MKPPLEEKIAAAKRRGYRADMTQDSDGFVYWSLFNDHKAIPEWTVYDFIQWDDEPRATEIEAWEVFLEYLEMRESKP